jgi:cytidylate kinase
LRVVAIDGPVGVGKSSVSRLLAERLGFLHLDTGAMYRAVAWKVTRHAAEDRGGEAFDAEALRLRLEWRPDGTLWTDGTDITHAIRTEEVSSLVHLAADRRAVREALVREQRRIGLTQPSVLEGRDIGTIVFPDARWKFFLDAPALARARRRVTQLKTNGQKADLDKVMAGLIDRDRRDRAREWGALRMAEDAVYVDTSELGEKAVVDLLAAVVRADSGREE